MSLTDYEYSFQINPIYLIQGIATTGALGISALLNTFNLNAGVTQPTSSINPTFASFRPVPGHSLINNAVATYPFSNQTTAANAIITEPLEISLEMIVPANSLINVNNKLSIITRLKQQLDQHTALGGWYSVATPSYVYQGCLLTQLVDASEEEDGAQPQVRWIWNFMQPLITSDALQAAQNQGMSKTTTQTFDPNDPPGASQLLAYYSLASANISQNIVPSNAGGIAGNIAPTSSISGTPSLTSISPIPIG